MMKCFELPSGQKIPVLGMGTWRMGENVQWRQAEVAALRCGMELGLSLIDTAEMYGEGGAEEVVAEAVGSRRSNSRRSEVFLVSKVYPHNASREGVLAACDRSLSRLKTDYLDLYLLHWPGSFPISETIAAFQALKQAGKIRDYGVSNFDVRGMEAATKVKGGGEIATNQILYNLSRRGVELDLLPWCQQREIPVMAYSPIEQGRLLNEAALKQVAQEKGVSVAQVAIAWLLHQDNVVVIPKSSRIEHIEQNVATLEIALSAEEIEILEAACPAPRKPIPLQML